MIADIERTLELNASQDAVWTALTDPEGIAGWFSDQAEIDPSGENEGAFIWDKHGRYALRIEACEPKTRFAWRWAREPNKALDESPSTLVEWTLTPRPGGGTTLHMKESGFLNEESRLDNVGGWKSELAELVEYLTE